jgi:hypothetical protein
MGGGEEIKNEVKERVRATTKGWVAWAVKMIEEGDHSTGLEYKSLQSNHGHCQRNVPPRSLYQRIEAQPTRLPLRFFFGLTLRWRRRHS